MSSHSYLQIENENIFININGEFAREMKLKYLSLIVAFFLVMEYGEVIFLHKSKLVFINEHLDRLWQSARGISLDIPLSKEDIIFEIEKVLKKREL